jgi:hypothetical protein
VISPSHTRAMLGSMVGLAVVLFPFVLMAFALSMERVETRVRRTGLGEDEVEQFLDEASASEVQTLVNDGMPRALDVFRLRHHPPRAPARERSEARRTEP